MKKVILLAALLGGVSFASKATNVETLPQANPALYFPFHLCGVCGLPDMDLPIDDSSDEGFEASQDVAMFYLGIYINAAANCH